MCIRDRPYTYVNYDHLIYYKNVFLKQEILTRVARQNNSFYSCKARHTNHSQIITKIDSVYIKNVYFQNQQYSKNKHSKVKHFSFVF